MKSTLKSLLLALGYQIKRAEPDIVDFLRSRRIDLVLDVGANAGQFGLELRARSYHGEIVSFEPIESVFDHLRQVAASDGRWRAVNLALGATSSTAVINVSDDSRFSSLLKQTPEAKQFDAAAEVVRVETIRVERLDDIFHQFGGNNVFLKIDAQGFEREVLEGASDSLRHVLGVQLELPIRHFYERTWSLPEALAYMERKSFRLSQVRPTNYDANDPPSAVELDCVFRRMD